MIGKTIGRYQIIDKLGEGGMGTVYKAEDTTLNRMVALKSLSGHLVKNEEAKERFIREAQAASALNHNNITTVYDLLEDEEQHFICMEYVDGKTLRDLVASGRVSVKKAVDIILQTAEALEAAHNKGILHRDIKSANIMVNVEDQVKVMDFGLAHLEERSQLTRTGTTMGTLSYASPEQVSGRKVDARSEIFSLGVVSYELLTGQLPFTGTSEAETVLAIISGEAKPISEHRGDVSDSLEAVVSRMIQKDPELRYQSCTELISDLKTIEAGLETSTMPITAALSAARAARRKAMAVRIAAGAAVVVIAVMAGILLTNRGPSLASDKILVAVFENETGDPAHDPVGKMMADYLVRGLQQIPFIEVLDPRVVSSSLQVEQSSSGYAESVRALAEEMGAGTIVSGAYYLLGDSLQFQAQVTETRTGRILRTMDPVNGSVTNPLDGVGFLQEGVLASIAVLFSPEFAPLAQVMSPPRNYEAYLEYIAGVESYSRGDQQVAFGHFSRALALDSTFVPAALYAAAALNASSSTRAKAESLAVALDGSRERLTIVERHVLDWLLATLRGERGKAYQAARQAFELAPNSGELAAIAGQAAVYHNHPSSAVEILTSVDPSRGFLKTWQSYWLYLTKACRMLGEHELELEAARRGWQQFPDLLTSRFWEVNALAALGRVDDLDRLIEQSLTTLPQEGNTFGDLSWAAAITLRSHGYLEEARDKILQAVDWYRALPPEVASTRLYRWFLAITLYEAELWEETGELFRNLVVEGPEVLRYIGYLGVTEARLGHREEALRISEQLANFETPYIYGEPHYWHARIAALLGNKEQVIQLLIDAITQGDTYGIWPWLVTIDFESLRDYPPFQELLRPKG